LVVVGNDFYPTEKNKTMENLALVKAKEAKEIKRGLMLSDSFLKANQLLQILQSTPKEHIYRRPGKGGGEFEYVTGTYIKKVLNHVFGWQWDFEVKNHGKEGKAVWVLGKLTIKDGKGNARIVKEQFGRADIKEKKTGGDLDFGNDLKSAATDALKKCASELGIASDIYGKSEFKEIKAKGYETQETIKDDKLSGLMASEIDIARIKRVASEMGLDTIAKIEKKIGLSVNFRGMTKTQSGMVYAKLLAIQTQK